MGGQTQTGWCGLMTNPQRGRDTERGRVESRQQTDGRQPAAQCLSLGCKHWKQCMWAPSAAGEQHFFSSFFFQQGVKYVFAVSRQICRQIDLSERGGGTAVRKRWREPRQEEDGRTDRRGSRRGGWRGKRRGEDIHAYICKGVKCFFAVSSPPPDRLSPLRLRVLFGSIHE